MIPTSVVLVFSFVCDVVGHCTLVAERPSNMQCVSQGWSTLDCGRKGTVCCWDHGFKKKLKTHLFEKHLS